MIKPAIVAVGYNRPEAMKRLLLSVNNAVYPFEDITLIVSIDECKESDLVETAARSVGWKHGELQIRRFPERQGLRKHVIQCGDLTEQYGAVIVLEDDLFVSPSFYQYTYEAVNFYETDRNVAGVALYGHAWNGYAELEFRPMQNEYDAYFGQFSISWGQCWTKAQWRKFKLWYQENENKLPLENPKLPNSILSWSDQSWGKYFVSYIVEKNLYYVSPYVALSTNFSDVGQHCTQSGSAYQVSLMSALKKNYVFPTMQQAVKYDIFFERDFAGIEIAGIDGADICVDLNMSRVSTLSKRYLLSPEKYDYKVLKSFAMAMHPIDANIIYDIQGNDIFLYDCEETNIRLTPNRCHGKRMSYDMYEFWWKSLLKIGIKRLYNTIRNRMKL